MDTFSKTSLERLNTCHPDLIKVFHEVIKHRDCIIICGHRNQADQDEAFKNGFSTLKYPHGRHNHSPSLAVDSAPNPLPDWHDIKAFITFADLVKKIADEMKIDLDCGAHWKSFPDFDHFELKVK